jgi:hypothetical protein
MTKALNKEVKVRARTPNKSAKRSMYSKLELGLRVGLEKNGEKKKEGPKNDMPRAFPDAWYVDCRR